MVAPAPGRAPTIKPMMVPRVMAPELSANSFPVGSSSRILYRFLLRSFCLALRFADELAVLNNGRLQIWGPPEEVYRSGVLNQSFGVRLRRFSADGSWQYYYA